MKPLRVLMVSEPGRYGVLMFVRNLIGHLHAECPEVLVDYAYSSERGSRDSDELVAAVQARGGEVFDMKVGSMPGIGDVRAARGILDLVRRRRPDVVHAHSSKAGALVRGLALLPGFPPVIYSPHGYYGMSLRGGMKDRGFNAIESALGRRGWTHNVSIHEREFAREVLKLPPEKLLLVFSGVDLDRFRPATPEEKRARREELGLPAEGRLLVTLGRDVYEKNYGDLYRALDRVLPELPGVFFAHAGGGATELRDGLGATAQARTKAYTFLDCPDKLLQAADGFVLVSRSEAFGLVAYEALGCGLPLILTGTMGLLSLKSLGFPGVDWIPNPADHGDVSREIGEAIRRWAAGDSGEMPTRTEIRRWFDSRVQFGKLVRAYRSLAERR